MNRDTILKYLSGLMNADEQLQFEQQLESNPELKAEYDRINSSLKELNDLNKVESESVYFNNLIPRMHKKMNENNGKGLVRFVPSFSFAIVILMIFLLQFPNLDENSVYELNYSDNEIASILSETDDSLLSDYLELGLVDNFSYYSYETDDSFPDVYIDQTILSEIGLEQSDEYYDYGLSANINDYSSEEANIIYEELINKKIL